MSCGKTNNKAVITTTQPRNQDEMVLRDAIEILYTHPDIPDGH
jgi:hypothetical protein